MQNLETFITKYSDRKYPNQISTKTLDRIWERVGMEYLSPSLFRDVTATHAIRSKTSNDPSADLLKALKRIAKQRI